MKIATIVSSNSHVDYVGRVIDSFDAVEVPRPEDFGFARFVSIDCGDGNRLVGVIYDSRLVNPDYANFGPRLSPRHELSQFSPDYLDEQGILVGIMAIGSCNPDGRFSQGFPRRAAPAGQSVSLMAKEEIRDFHAISDGRLEMAYFSQIVAHAKAFAVPLLEAIIDELNDGAGEDEKRTLAVFKQSLLWQRTVGGIRL